MLAELDFIDQPATSFSEIRTTTNKGHATPHLETLRKVLETMWSTNNYDTSFLMGFLTTAHNYLTLANDTGVSVIILP